jgi:hypothetical protein
MLKENFTLRNEWERKLSATRSNRTAEMTWRETVMDKLKETAQVSKQSRCFALTSID